MNITKAERLVLNELSKEVYGASSFWRTILKRGVVELAKDGLGVTIEPKKVGRKNKVVKRTVITWYTPETVKELMLSLKARNDALKAELKNETNSKGS